MRYGFVEINGDFKCVHCRHIVSSDPFLSGVVNRNHCPYCLRSRHLDLHTAGDRLSACKSPMEPVGLTLKRNSNKYGKEKGGELMLIHRCTACGKLSINRVAADDDADTLYDLFADTLSLDSQTREQLKKSGVILLGPADEGLVRARLYGWGAVTGMEPAYRGAVN